MTAMLARLIAQAEGEGAELLTLRALVEEASELGAGRALAAMGLADGTAGADVAELRQLLGAWRDAKRSARQAFVTWLVGVLLAALLVGVAVTVGMGGTLGGVPK